jgi:hypothetical protein
LNPVGTVHLHVAQHIHALSVIVELYGIAMTQLHHNEHSNSSPPQRCSEPERIHRFLRTTRTLWTADTSSSVIQPGTYCWVFTLDFPIGTGKLPSSYTTPRNTIQYFLKTQLKTPKRTMEPTCTLELFFQDRIDVDSTRLRTPVVIDLETEAYLGSFWKRLFRQQNAKGNVKATVTLPKRGYCPGDTVDIVIHVAHFCSVFIAKAIKVQLRQKTVFLGKTQVDTHRKTLVEAITALDVPTGSTESTVVCHLKLPPDLPVTNIACNVLQITYKLKVSIRVTESKFIQSKTLFLRFPLVIGTYRSSRDRGGGTATWRAQQWEAWVQGTTSQDELPDYVGSGDMRVMVWPENQPPTYEASVTSRGASVGTPSMLEASMSEGYLTRSLERNDHRLALSASSTFLNEARPFSNELPRAGSLNNVRDRRRRTRRSVLPI